MFFRKKKFSRIVGGKKAKQAGELFEEMLETAGKRCSAEVVRIPNGSRIAHVKGKLISINIKSPFDYVIAKNKSSVFVDCKTIESGNFSHSKVKTHQAENLNNLEKQGFAAGYIVYFRARNKITFFKASVLSSLKPRESLKHDQGFDLGNSRQFNIEKLFLFQENNELDAK